MGETVNGYVKKERNPSKRNVILGWKFIVIFNWEKKTLLDQEKFVYLIFIPKYLNIVTKDMNQTHSLEIFVLISFILYPCPLSRPT